jgi:hypothetical protein
MYPPDKAYYYPQVCKGFQGVGSTPLWDNLIIAFKSKTIEFPNRKSILD